MRVHPWRAMTALVATLLLIAAVAACGQGDSTDSTGPRSTDGDDARNTITVLGMEIAEDPELNAMLPVEILDAGVVEVASDLPFPPWEMWTAPGSDEMTGADVELGRAIGAKLGVPFEFEQTVFDAIIPALQAGKADLVMANMYDNVKRQEVLDFIDYAKAGTGILVKKGNPEGITGPESLAGKTVAVQKGTVYLEFAQKLREEFKAVGKPELKILQFPKDSDAQLAVKAGKAACDILDAPAGGYAAKIVDGGEAFELVQDPTAPNGYDPAWVGIGMLKGRNALRDAIAAAMQQLIDDGTYAKIFEYFGVRGAEIDKVKINAGGSK